MTSHPVAAAGNPPVKPHLDHVALVVGSLDRATHFYSHLLDLEVLNRVRLSDHTIQYLSSRTGAPLELIAYDEGAAGQPLNPPSMPASHHLAWQVPDVEDLQHRVIELGGLVISAPVYMPELQQTSLLIRDPDGFLIELVER